MKFAVLCLLFCAAISSSHAQANLGLNIGLGRPSFMGFPPSQFFLDVVLQNEAQKLLTQPNLPADLQQRVVDTLARAELGLNNCNTVATTLPWVQIRCIMLQVQTSKAELKAIDDEAKARAQAAATPATPASGSTA